MTSIDILQSSRFVALICIKVILLTGQNVGQLEVGLLDIIIYGSLIEWITDIVSSGDLARTVALIIPYNRISCDQEGLFTTFELTQLHILIKLLACALKVLPT